MRVLLDECIDGALRRSIVGHDQQRLRDREIALVILEGHSTNLDDLPALVPDVLIALEAIKSGDIVRVGNRSGE